MSVCIFSFVIYFFRLDTEVVVNFIFRSFFCIVVIRLFVIRLCSVVRVAVSFFCRVIYFFRIRYGRNLLVFFCWLLYYFFFVGSLVAY